MKIGFDLDKVLVNYPPIVPSFVIDYLYKDHAQKELTYRIPEHKLEQIIRRLSHYHLLRPKIAKNVSVVKTLKDSQKHQIYLISSRYGFLEQLTLKLLERYKMKGLFDEIYLNNKNEQPHLFKEKVINTLKLDIFIDDDLDLLRYLKEKCPQTMLLWYNPRGDFQPMNINVITEITDIKKYLK